MVLIITSGIDNLLAIPYLLAYWLSGYSYIQDAHIPQKQLPVKYIERAQKSTIGSERDCSHWTEDGDSTLLRTD